MKKLLNLAHEKLVHILGGHGIGINIYGCQPNLEMAIYSRVHNSVERLFWAGYLGNHQNFNPSLQTFVD